MALISGMASSTISWITFQHCGSTEKASARAWTSGAVRLNEAGHQQLTPACGCAGVHSACHEIGGHARSVGRDQFLKGAPAGTIGIAREGTGKRNQEIARQIQATAATQYCCDSFVGHLFRLREEHCGADAEDPGKRCDMATAQFSFPCEDRGNRGYAGSRLRGVTRLRGVRPSFKFT